MQFLVIGRSTASGWNQDDINLTRMGVKQFRDDGRTKAIYGFAGENGGCLICECNTAQELNQYLSLNPLFLNNEWEIHSLVTADESLAVLDAAEKHLESMGRAA